MKFFAIWFFLLMVVCNGLPFDSAGLRAMFESYKRDHGRTYSSSKEELNRFRCFAENLRRIQERNRQDTASHGVNIFTDLCPEEFRARYLSSFALRVPRSGTTNAVNTSGVEPPLIDWREKGGVGPIKDQGQCESCWAFGAVAAMEGAWNLKNRPSPFLQLSEEFLVQCSQRNGSSCTAGGEPRLAIAYVIRNHGIPSEASYPYTSGGGWAGPCSEIPAQKAPAAQFRELAGLTAYNEPAIADALVKFGPLFALVDSTQWQYYSSGVSSLCGFTQLTHAVAIVGVGQQGSTYYWIVRNSWGTNWGENGYIYLQYGVNCNAIASEVGTALAL
eukprot:RCo041297